MKPIVSLLLIILLNILSGCNTFIGSGDIQNVGMLLEGSIDESAWNEKGYEGLQQIEKEFNIDIFYKENMNSKSEVATAVDEMVEKGVNLIFGHSSQYGELFSEIAEYYPEVHFVYSNGGVYEKNVTSLNFNSHAMGFFGGMIAGEMTTTNKVGIIASFLWQPEIEGFYEGVKYQNPQATVEINYIKSWDDTETAVEMYEKMNKEGVDIFYPAGDGYSEEIIRLAEQDGKFIIGYVDDQLDLAPETVLTSTVQSVDKLYVAAAEKYNKGKLEGDILEFDFQDEVISLGEFNQNVPEDFQEYMYNLVDNYIETNLLPNEQ